jgi:hypothetical protein
MTVCRSDVERATVHWFYSTLCRNVYTFFTVAATPAKRVPFGRISMHADNSPHLERGRFRERLVAVVLHEAEDIAAGRQGEAIQLCGIELHPALG